MKITKKIDRICWIINFLFCIIMLINIIWLALENYDLRQDILKKEVIIDSLNEQKISLYEKFMEEFDKSGN